MNRPEDFFSLYKDALLRKDGAQMKGLYHEDITMFDLWDDFSLRGESAVGAMIDGWFDSIADERVDVDFSDLQVIGDGDAAFGNGYTEFKAYDGEGQVLRRMRERITVCLIREGERWYVVNQHTSVPIKLETGKGIFR